jgi:hypothetical protein
VTSANNLFGYCTIYTISFGLPPGWNWFIIQFFLKCSIFSYLGVDFQTKTCIIT